MAEHSERLEAQADPARVLVLITYILHLLGSVAGVPSFIAVVLNYLKRTESDAQLTTHHAFMIRTFWWTLLWVFVGALTKALLIGWLVLGAVWLWFVYRQVLGLIRLANAEPMPVYSER